MTYRAEPRGETEEAGSFADLANLTDIDADAELDALDVLDHDPSGPVQAVSTADETPLPAGTVSFEPLEGERLERMASHKRGPMKWAAGLVLSVQAQRGRPEAEPSEPAPRVEGDNVAAPAAEGQDAAAADSAPPAEPPTASPAPPKPKRRRRTRAAGPEAADELTATPPPAPADEAEPDGAEPDGVEPAEADTAAEAPVVDAELAPPRADMWPDRPAEPQRRRRRTRAQVAAPPAVDEIEADLAHEAATSPGSAADDSQAAAPAPEVEAASTGAEPEADPAPVMAAEPARARRRLRRRAADNAKTATAKEPAAEAVDEAAATEPEPVTEPETEAALASSPVEVEPGPAAEVAPAEDPSEGTTRPRRVRRRRKQAPQPPDESGPAPTTSLEEAIISNPEPIDPEPIEPPAPATEPSPELVPAAQRTGVTRSGRAPRRAPGRRPAAEGTRPAVGEGARARLEAAAAAARAEGRPVPRRISARNRQGEPRPSADTAPAPVLRPVAQISGWEATEEDEHAWEAWLSDPSAVDKDGQLATLGADLARPLPAPLRLAERWGGRRRRQGDEDLFGGD